MDICYFFSRNLFLLLFFIYTSYSSVNDNIVCPEQWGARQKFRPDIQISGYDHQVDPGEGPAEPLQDRKITREPLFKKRAPRSSRPRTVTGADLDSCDGTTELLDAFQQSKRKQTHIINLGEKIEHTADESESSRLLYSTDFDLSEDFGEEFRFFGIKDDVNLFTNERTSEKNRAIRRHIDDYKSQIEQLNFSGIDVDILLGIADFQRHQFKDPKALMQGERMLLHILNDERKYDSKKRSLAASKLSKYYERLSELGSDVKSLKYKRLAYELDPLNIENLYNLGSNKLIPDLLERRRLLERGYELTQKGYPTGKYSWWGALFLHALGENTNNIDLIKKALKLAEQLNAPMLFSKLTLRYAKIKKTSSLDDYDEELFIKGNLEKSLSFARTDNNQPLLALVHMELGRRHAGSTIQKEHYQEALRLGQSLKSLGIQARAHAGLGFCYKTLTEGDRLGHFDRAMDFSKQIGDHAHQSNILHGKGMILKIQKKFSEAKKCFEEALAVCSDDHMRSKIEQSLESYSRHT